MNNKITKSTAAIIEKNGKVLIAKRKKDSYLGGKWEFPGGKIEDKETPKECLKREMKEELGIKVKVGELIKEASLLRIKNAIKMKAFLVKYISGKFRLTEHEEMKWVAKEDLMKYDFVKVDKDIIKEIMDS